MDGIAAKRQPHFFTSAKARLVAAHIFISYATPDRAIADKVASGDDG